LSASAAENLVARQFSALTFVAGHCVHVQADAVSEASVAGKGKEAGGTASSHTARVWDTSRAAVASRTTNTILMVAPIGFQLNEETAQDNHFMHRPKEEALDTERKVRPR
jgi:Flp pilus assembly protein TadG